MFAVCFPRQQEMKGRSVQPPARAGTWSHTWQLCELGKETSKKEGEINPWQGGIGPPAFDGLVRALEVNLSLSPNSAPLSSVSKPAVSRSVSFPDSNKSAI